MKRLHLVWLIIFLTLVNIQSAWASHIIGGDLLYTWISGNTYKITLTLYGDCDLNNQVFNNLPQSIPVVDVYNGSTLYQSVDLSITGTPSQVTPVCPQWATNTKCTNTSSTVPGIKRFIYTANVTLNANSVNWRFRFDGQLNNSLAGRTNSITNVVIGSSGSIMSLEAKLNNFNFPNNSSPQYTTIPTPFFCINQPSSYNPGAVDPNNDSLTFGLINALEPTTTVTYVTGFSGSAPLAANAVSFNATNGQYNFTPNAVQISVVANELKEYRNGILVGTSMREMNFIVQSNCSNVPPNGSLSTPSGGVILTPTSFRACPSADSVKFQVNPTDANGDSITVTYSGIPAGAVATVTNNNTPTPTFTFNWNLSTAVPGATYTIYLTLQDYGCPISAKQIIAYTIYILPNPKVGILITQQPTCYSKTHFTMTPLLNTSPWNVIVDNASGTTVKTWTNINTSVNDSLDPGTYTFHITDGYGCTHDTMISFQKPPFVHVAIDSIVQPKCNGDSSGKIVLHGISGIPPFTYAIGSGAYSPSGTFSNLAAGTYTIHIKDNNLCTLDTSVTIVNPNPILLNTTFQKPPCNSFQNGSITLQAYNSTAPYTYSFNGSGFTSATTYSGLFSGTYPVIVKDGKGCQKSFNAILPDSIKIAATITNTNILCYGDTSSMVTVNATNGFPPYTYSYNSLPIQVSNVLGAFPAGTFTIHVKDTEGCYWDSLITIVQPDSIMIKDSVKNPLCSYSLDGVIYSWATGGKPPYKYSINGGLTYSTSGIFTGLGNGSYTITVMDSNNCINDILITLNSPTKLQIGIVIDSTTCLNSPDGAIHVTANGGKPPYTYSIGSGFQPSPNFTGLPAGTYTVTVKDSNSCTKDTVVEIFDPIIVPIINIVNPKCVDDSTGKIYVSAQGGKPNYTYSLSFGGPYQIADSFVNLPWGTYTVFIKDSKNCIKDTSINLINPNHILIDTTFKKPPCNSFQNGGITVSAYNSTAPYTYALDNNPFQSSGVFTGLYSGPYTIKVKNAVGCEEEFPVILPDSIKIYATLDLIHNKCFGDTLGSITVNASSGFPPYTFALGSGAPQIGNVFTPLPANTYFVHVKDTEACYWDSMIVITQPDSLQILDSTIRISCRGANDGQIYTTILGGKPPYTYSLDGGTYGTTSFFVGLDSGYHTVSILDSNNCYRIDSFYVYEPPALKDSIIISLPLCYGNNNGVITVYGVGGTAPYTYAIGSGTYSSNNSFSGLVAGTYTIHVKDTFNCIKDTNVVVGQPDSIHIRADIRNSTCATLGDGKVTIHATGGTKGYTYAINSGLYGTDSLFTSVPAGTHVFTIKDSNGCTKDTFIDIVDSMVLSADIFIQDAFCNSSTTGLIAIKGTGGTPAYVYSINGLGYSPLDTFINLLSGTHPISSKDAFGCIFDTVVNINQPTPLTTNISWTPPLCYNDNSAIITVSGNNGTPPYTYSIDQVNYDPTGVFNNLLATTYTVTVKDSKGCTKDSVIVITQPTPLQMSVQTESNLCFGDNSGTIIVQGLQATPPYSYSVDNGLTNTSGMFNVTSGYHVVSVFDDNGCQLDTTLFISQPTPVNFKLTIKQPTCQGFLDGEIKVQGLGGVGNYTYAINNGAFTTYGLYQNLPAGTYTISVKDSNGCQHDTVFNLVGFTDPGVSALDIMSESCYGNHDGVITVTPNGFSPFTFSILNLEHGNMTGVFQNLASGYYVISIEDNNGCISDTQVFVPTPDQLEVDILITPNDCDYSANEGQLTAAVVGGTRAYLYTWKNESNPSQIRTDSIINNLSNGKYIVYVQDAHGCEDSAEATVTFGNCCKPYIPNAFSPNGDNQNEIFKLQFTGDVELKFFQIYNRWGQMVFETKDLSQGWDGKYKDKDVDVDVYTYHIKFICGNEGNKVIDLTGDVTLIR